MRIEGFEKSGGQFGTVEVFPVGKQQFKDFVASGTVDIPVYTSQFVACDTYVILLKDVHFGRVRPGITAWPGYWTMTEALAKLPDQYEDLEEQYGIGMRYCREVEIWRIVDDAELWQDWEYGVVQSHIAQGCDTDYHLLQNFRCVLDCVGKLPKVVYCIYATLADGESVYSVDYYDDAVKFGVALHTALMLHDCALDSVDTFFASELGITVVNDDDLDEGRADALPVSVFYVSLPDDDVTASITK